MSANAARVTLVRGFAHGSKTRAQASQKLRPGMDAATHNLHPATTGGAGPLIQPSASAYACTLLGSFDRRFLRKPAVRGILIAVLVAAILVPCVQFALTIQETDAAPFRPSGEQHRTALGRWIPTAELVARDPHQADPYGYGHWFPLPPLVLLALTPLPALGYIGAGIAFALAKVVGLAAALPLFVRQMAKCGMAVPLGVLVIAAAFGLRPIVSDLQHGNVNIFVLVWLALCWACYMARWDYLAGVFLGLGVVTKITPALLIVYFFYKKEWRVALTALAASAAAFFLVPSAYLGLGHNWQLLVEWFNMLVEPYLVEGYTIINTDNQSLYSVIVRLLDAGGWIDLHPMPAPDALVAGSDVMAKPPSAALLRPMVSLPILATLALCCRAKTASRHDMRLLLEFSLVLLAMLLLSERTWKHHATTLILVYLSVWFAVACMPWRHGVRAFFVGGLGLQWLLLVGTSEGVLGDDLANLIAFNGGFGWGLLLAFVELAAMLWALASPRRWMAQGGMANAEV